MLLFLSPYLIIESVRWVPLPRLVRRHIKYLQRPFSAFRKKSEPITMIPLSAEFQKSKSQKLCTKNNIGLERSSSKSKEMTRWIKNHGVVSI